MPRWNYPSSGTRKHASGDVVSVQFVVEQPLVSLSAEQERRRQDADRLDAEAGRLRAAAADKRALAKCRSEAFGPFGGTAAETRAYKRITQEAIAAETRASKLEAQALALRSGESKGGGGGGGTGRSSANAEARARTAAEMPPIEIVDMSEVRSVLTRPDPAAWLLSHELTPFSKPYQGYTRGFRGLRVRRYPYDSGKRREHGWDFSQLISVIEYAKQQQLPSLPVLEAWQY